MPSRYSANRLTEEGSIMPPPVSRPGVPSRKSSQDKGGPWQANIGPTGPNRNKVGFRKVKAWPKSHGI